jgi:peroxiredoxin Q/BCP
MCSLRDAASELSGLGARVLGISLDDVVSLAAFAEAQQLAFPLLSDADGSAARKFGVLTERGFAQRVTFVISPQGEIRHVDRQIDVTKHGADLAALLRKLQAP